MSAISLKINGKDHGPIEVRDDLSMNDFLREVLGMTGTKFGCGAAQCLSCAVIVDDPDGTSATTPTCIVTAASFDGKSIRTVEGHASNGQLTALQQAFIKHFAFQCGYCTAGFLNEAQVLLEALERQPVARETLEQTILEALDGHLCRREENHEGQREYSIDSHAKFQQAEEDVASLGASAAHGYADVPFYRHRPVKLWHYARI